MPRRGRFDKHPLLPDARYNSLLVSRFINKLMMRGKKGIAEGILYGTIEELERRAKRPGIEVFEQALRNATPVIEVKPRRVGGATYQVPGRDQRRTPPVARHQVAPRRSPQALRQEHGGPPLRRADGRLQQRRHDHQEAGRYPQDGRGEQGFRALQVLISTQNSRTKTRGGFRRTRLWFSCAQILLICIQHYINIDGETFKQYRSGNLTPLEHPMLPILALAPC